MQRAAAQADAGRESDDAAADGQLATDEPLADWELELLKQTSRVDADAAPAEAAPRPAAAEPLPQPAGRAPPTRARPTS